MWYKKLKESASQSGIIDFKKRLSHINSWNSRIETPSDPAVISKYFIYFIFAFTLIFITLFNTQGHAPSELKDPDCYMRLNRVVQLHESGKWYDAIYARSNAPFGENLHWTRPLDSLLFAGAWLASPLAGFKNGLFWWGILISPFLLIASFMALLWAFRPILGVHTSHLIGLLFIFQLGVMGGYSIARPDHHSLLGFTFIITTGLTLRLIMGSFNRTICYLAGMMSAFSLWIHVESMIPIFLSFLLLGFFWIFEDDDFTYKNMHYSVALFIFISVALVLERPWYDLTRIEYDKISLVHWFIFGLISLFWVAVFSFRHHLVFPQQGRTGRFAIASLAAVIVALCVCLLFPDFYRGGYANINPRIVPIWLDKVSEVQPPQSRDFLMPLIQLLGSALIGIAYIVFVLWKEPDKNVKGWVFILSGILLFATAGMFQRRLLLYGNIITIVPLAALMGRALRWEINHVRHVFRAFILSFTIMAFCLGLLDLGYLCQNFMKKGSVLKGEDKSVPLSQLCGELNKLDTNQARPPRILACIDYGPEILYRTRYEVVGTPYHRNSQGILDTFKIMTAESDEEAYELIHRRKIDMILISNKSAEIKFNSLQHKQSTFDQCLRTENFANWLRAVELPYPISSTYRLFQVIR